ncbi:MAG: cbb3-type cytochrome c oxidase subunit I [Anaerolineae bacterium]|nr:cbb3-type cytochrome c oxidase subunit I [Thermoflexales bacterium]MDW8407199.1 cbb3-type cytochrome c oxidase subunit I [Anaerolineae bacterium]
MQATHVRPAPVPVSFPALDMLRSERNLVGVHIASALIALTVGIFMGPFQAFHRAPAFAKTFIGQIPVFSYYYQAVTVHGVMLALFFTTLFIVGFSYYVVQRSLQRPIKGVRFAWVAFALMLIGLALLVFSLANDVQRSAVLYTFYPPMIAPAVFYIGLVLLVVGSWIAAFLVFWTYNSWRKDHPGERVPLAVFAIIVNFLMWFISSLGVAVEVLFMLLPASLGWIQTTDPQVARALFWFFGHPLVYFWLIPAYVSWYTMLPKQAGGRLFSDPLARVAFIMLLLFSIPVGVHHMYADPGVSQVAKFVHAFLTFTVAVPSFMTAFNIGASLEIASRNNGGRGIVGFFLKQRWNDPVVAAQLVGMLLFLAGGITGLMNASAQINITLHNTSWVPGHFHTTLGGGVTMTFFGILYWLLPMLRGRALFSKKAALAQAFTWLVGMALFGFSMGEAGLNGAPRRADLAAAPYISTEAGMWLNGAAIGGMILLVSVVLLFVNIIGTLFFSNKPVEVEAPIQTKVEEPSPAIFERWRVWIAIVVVLCLFAWGPVFAEVLDFNAGFNAIPYTTSGAPLR